MERKTLFAVVLSILVIVTFQFMMAKKYPRQQITRTAEAPLPSSRQQARPVDVTREVIPLDEEEYVVETDRFVFVFSNVGGSIKRIELKEYEDPETAEPYVLADIKDPRFYIGAFNLVDQRIQDDAIYQMSKYGDKISYKYSTQDISIEKIYTIPNYSDCIELDTIIKNASASEIKANSRLVAASGIDASGAMAQRYINVSTKLDGKIARDKRDSIRSGDVSWTALSNKYFCILLRPYQLGRKTFTNVVTKGNIVGGIESALFVIPPASEVTQQYLYYVGPLDAARMKALNMGIEEAVDYGFFGGISKVLLKTLRFFHKITRNWGVAIICLTVLVNIILLPLTRKSYKSMRAMQELQPHIDKLRTVHKDNPHKMNKELMELYKTYKVNPLGGCLPLFLQMPIFISLYHALVRSIELKGANFLWIRDLSSPDAVKLPFSLPILGNSVNILPILMMVAMIVQQKISTPHKTAGMSDQQKQQQQMMLMMPVIFVVIFYSLPSGLVLYWLVNTVLMVIHQYHIKKAPTAIQA